MNIPKPHRFKQSLKKHLLPSIALLLSTGMCGAQELQPARIFTSHMVLQRDQPVQIWGTAAAGQRVVAKLGEAEAETLADEKGCWRVTLPEHPAGGPHLLTITGEKTLTYEDILFGEVWLGSGQSNMHMALKDGRGGVLNAADEIAAADYPQIRLLQIANGRDKHDARFVNRWTPTTPESARGFSATLYFFGRRLHQELNVPIGVINASQGGSPIAPWRVDGALYRKCVEPLTPIALRGVLWYQGESNVGLSSAAYRDHMQSLITGWREVWDAPLPFYYVQIAPVLKKSHFQQPLIWEAQTQTLALPATGMISTMDLGDQGNIHPKYKQAVGNRLAALALHEQYGQKDLQPYSPRYDRMTPEDGALRVHFVDAKGGLVTRNGDAPDWCQLAGADRQFRWADARIDGETLVVASADVPEPVSVRFAWDGLAEPNLMGKISGLPVIPFRSDDWPTPASLPEAAPLRLVPLPVETDLDVLGSALRENAPLKLISGGRTYAQVWLGESGGNLVIDVDVCDARESEQARINGAIVEVYLSAREVGSTVRQIVFEPRAIATEVPFKLYEMGKQQDESPEIQRRVVALTPTGYRLTATIPFAAYGVDPHTQDVGLEMAIVTANAKDAKPRWMSLFGSIGAFRDNNGFCQIIAE